MWLIFSFFLYLRMTVIESCVKYCDQRETACEKSIDVWWIEGIEKFFEDTGRILEVWFVSRSVFTRLWCVSVFWCMHVCKDRPRFVHRWLSVPTCRHLLKAITSFFPFLSTLHTQPGRFNKENYRRRQGAVCNHGICTRLWHELLCCEGLTLGSFGIFRLILASVSHDFCPYKSRLEWEPLHKSEQRVAHNHKQRGFYLLVVYTLLSVIHLLCQS